MSIVIPTLDEYRKAQDYERLKRRDFFVDGIVAAIENGKSGLVFKKTGQIYLGIMDHEWCAHYVMELVSDVFADTVYYFWIRDVKDREIEVRIYVND